MKREIYAVLVALSCLWNCPPARAQWGSIRAENHAAQPQQRAFPAQRAAPPVQPRNLQQRPAARAGQQFNHPSQFSTPRPTVPGERGANRGAIGPLRDHGDAWNREWRPEFGFRDRDHWHEDLDDERRQGFYWYGFNPGMIINTLPPDYSQLYVGGNPYYYDQGVYYQPGPSGYVVVSPPMGAVVPALPPGAETIQVGPTLFYYAAGAFYTQVPQGFLVVAPPLGVTVDMLPPGAVPVNINGMIYYQADGAYFMPEIQDGITVYTTVQP